MNTTMKIIKLSLFDYNKILFKKACDGMLQTFFYGIKKNLCFPFIRKTQVS